MKNEFFKELVERVDSSTKLTSRLEALLGFPIQRIPQYGILLDELIKITQQDHPDYDFLNKSILLMDEVEKNMNNTIKQAEDEEKLKNLVPGAEVSLFLTFNL